MIKIASWNLNSVNARLELFSNWLSANQPDIVLLQELKCLEEKFPHQQLEDLGYNIAINGQKTYNGVAILSKFPLEEVIIDFEGNPDSSQARYIESVVSLPKNKVIRVISVYVPNGRDVSHDNYQYKLKFLNELGIHLQKLLHNDEMVIIGGDFNVALDPIDVFDESSCAEAIGFHLEERNKLRKIINSGYYDMFRIHKKDKQQFSWWDYRAGAWQKNEGLRIDYIFGSAEIGDISKNCYIDQNTRSLEKTSDHAPVILEIF